MLHSQFVDIGMEDLVHEADAWRLVWELLGQLYVDLPYALGERCWRGQRWFKIGSDIQVEARKPACRWKAKANVEGVYDNGSTEPIDPLSTGPWNLTKNSDILLLTSVTW